MGIGYGKVILFGEHFVVYGKPAIAASIENKTIAKIKPYKKGGILCNYKNRWKNKKLLEDDPETKWLKGIVIRLLDSLKITKTNFELYIESDLPVGIGLGSSAALSVAIVRAIGEYFKLGLNENKVSEKAFKAEQIFHGNPSGIDNTVATFGGLIWFKKNFGIRKLTLRKPLYVVIVDTPRKGSTKDLVENVAKFKEANEELFSAYLDEIDALSREAEIALSKNDLVKLGELMNRNQDMLKDIGVSNQKLDRLCKLALESGALGAKLTGAGGGGCMFALADSPKVQKKIAKALKKEGRQVILTKIGVQ